MFGKKNKDEQPKKKKGCLRRIISFFVTCFVLCAIAGFLFLDESEYISDEELSAAKNEEEVSIDDLLDLIYDWYGYIPDDYDEYNFSDNDYYDDYDWNDWNSDRDNLYTRRGGPREGHNHWGREYSDYNSGWDYYDNDYDDYYNEDYSNNDYYDNYNGYDYDNWGYEGIDDYSTDDGYNNYYNYDDSWDSERSNRRRERENRAYDNNYNNNNNQPTENNGIASSKPNTSQNGTNSKPNNPKNSSKSEEEKRALFISCAKKYTGTPYVWGGTSSSGIDCSGLVYLAAQEAGLGTLPRTAKTMFSIASKISDKDRKAGDLIFFQADNTISHVAIYLGDDQVLHAVSDGSKTGVITSKLSENYWKKHYYSAGRIITD